MAKATIEKPATYTPKEEKFIELYLAYSDATRAYTEAYSCTTRNKETIVKNAHALRHKPKIKIRIEEIRANMREASRITREFISEGIIRNIATAERQFLPAVAIRGYMELAKLYGITDTPPERQASIAQESAREIAQRYAQRQIKLVNSQKAIK